MSVDGDRLGALRAWARGDLALEAAVELIATALDGRLLTGPWVRPDEAGRLWFDPAVAEAEQGHLSGGERRVLAIAMSLASSEHPVDLGDAIAGLDPDALDTVLDALALAGGQGR
ncbi:hypothetical protein QYM46_13610 [Brevibacterium sp. K11IcPPYGO002]|uniref:hypothetical protein n=1 Tax=Brevibacterium sp. K11IcPPYGO002 TaxID=3058837 RepID=UPI003D81C34B